MTDRKHGKQDCANPPNKHSSVSSEASLSTESLWSIFRQWEPPPPFENLLSPSGHTRDYRRTSNYVFIKAEIKHINKMEIGFTECSKSGRFGRRTLAICTNQHIKRISSNRLEMLLWSGSQIKFCLINLLLSRSGSRVKISTNKTVIWEAVRTMPISRQ